MLDIVPSCNLGQYQGKLMMEPWENGKNPALISKPIWSPGYFFSRVSSRQCSKLSSYSISRKTNELNLKKVTKNLILGPILNDSAQIWARNFLWVLALFLIRHCSKLSSYTIEKKTNAPNLRKKLNFLKNKLI